MTHNMFLPFKDDNPSHGTPLLTYGLIGLCVLVFLYQVGLPELAMKHFVFTYGFIPGSFFEGTARSVPAEIPPFLTLFTSMFLHGDFMHLAGNMLYLWIFADNIESAMGKVKFILFYLLTGIAAALAHGALTPGSMIPMVGASGAISGVLGAYLLMYPKANVRIFIFFYFFWRVVNIPAWIVLGLWFGMQFLGAAGDSGDGAGVAFWAHIGGFVAGMILAKPFLKKGEYLFHERHSQAWELRGSDAAPKRDVQSYTQRKQEQQTLQGRGPLRRRKPKGPWE